VTLGPNTVALGVDPGTGLTVDPTVGLRRRLADICALRLSPRHWLLVDTSDVAVATASLAQSITLGETP